MGRPLPGLTWTKLKEGSVWPQLMVDLAISLHQKSLQFKYTFGAFLGPQLKFLPSGTMSNVCSRISGSSSTQCHELWWDTWTSGCEKRSLVGFSGLQAFSLGSSGNSSPVSPCCLLHLISLRGLGAVFGGKLSLEASLFLLLWEDKSLGSVVSSTDTWKKKILKIPFSNLNYSENSYIHSHIHGWYWLQYNTNCWAKE